MAFKKTKKERRGFFAMVFLVDPWRKLLALCLGFLSWHYISNQIMTEKAYEFSVVSIEPGSTDYKAYSINVPVPPGFVLWKVGGVPLSKRPKMIVRFKGPRNRMQKVTDFLQLAVVKKKLDKLSVMDKEIEITASDLIVPRYPQLNELIDAIITPDGKVKNSVVFEFERYINDKLFILSPEEAPYKVEGFPKEYEADTTRSISLKPSQVMLSGPENTLLEELMKKTIPGREPLLEEFVIHRGLRVQVGREGNPELIFRVKLRRSWARRGLSMDPKEGVEVHFPVRRKAFTINIPNLRIPVEFTGPGAENWEVMEGEHPDRHVIVKVFNQHYWYWVINKATSYPKKKENKKGQEEWVRKCVRLFVNVALLDPKKKREPRAPIHWVVLTDPNDFVDRSDIVVEIEESDRIGVQLKEPKKKG